MKSKKNLLSGIVAVCILVLSLVFTLLDALIPLNIWTHPALNFLFCIFLGFGVMTLVFAFKKESAWFFFLSAVLLGLAFFYVLMQYILWWIALIVLVVVLVIFAVVSFIVAGSQTENIALNKSSEYKTFEERKAEEIERLKNEENTEKPLPQIKSFKD